MEIMVVFVLRFRNFLRSVCSRGLALGTMEGWPLNFWRCGVATCARSQARLGRNCPFACVANAARNSVGPWRRSSWRRKPQVRKLERRRHCRLRQKWHWRRRAASKRRERNRREIAWTVMTSTWKKMTCNLAGVIMTLTLVTTKIKSKMMIWRPRLTSRMTSSRQSSRMMILLRRTRTTPVCNRTVPPSHWGRLTTLKKSSTTWALKGKRMMTILARPLAMNWYRTRPSGTSTLSASLGCSSATCNPVMPTNWTKRR
mmetsp:Transcript_13225/g.25250  ORF Transcript_13225/g.25250 Transcript_13225/m.25250 type:complete len:257 (+) Transcript_13225:1549-2319(+)